MQQFLLVITFFGLLVSNHFHANAQDDLWIKFGSALEYKLYNLDATGLNTDFQHLTGHDEVSFKDAKGVGYGSLFSFDIGLKHFFIGENWSWGLIPRDVAENYYEPVNTHTFGVPDNIEITLTRSQIEGRFGYGHFASNGEPGDAFAFFAYGGFVFMGAANYTIELNNYTNRNLAYEGIYIENSSLFNDFKTRRLVYGVGLISFVCFGTGPTSFGVGIEPQFSHCNAGNWKFDDENTNLPTQGFNTFSMQIAMRIEHLF